MRIYFIPGLGEEVFIFDKINPFIKGDKVFIDNWSLLADLPEENLTALVYAQFLIERFKITKQDVVIGHSLGGRVALHIKHIIQCPIVQIASWTDGKKIFRPPSRQLIYWSARHGIGLNSFVLKVLVFLRYRNAPSKDVFISIFKKLMSGDRAIVVKQLKAIFAPVAQKITATPDLRIHATADPIVKPPDEQYVKVDGDHFTLYTHPKQVYEPIVHFLHRIS